MTEKTAYVVDFDGTITTKDITSELAAFFGGTRFMEIEESYRKREIHIRSWLKGIAECLPLDFDLLITKALQWARIRNGFDSFLEHAADSNSPVVIASDGFGFYIEPILEKHGLLSKINQIYRNNTFIDEQGKISIVNPYAHRICSVCGNCKAAHVIALKDKGFSIVYIGDGSNDRFGASWSDHICPRDELADICREKEFNYSPWFDFYDIIKVGKPVLEDRSSVSLCDPCGSGIKE